MLSQALSTEQLMRCLQPRDCIRYGGDRKTAEALCTDASARINADSFSFAPFATKSIRGNRCFQAANLQDTLVLRKVADNLIRLHQLRPASRTMIVRQIAALLRDHLPMRVFRLDIKAFYESVETSVLVERLERTQRLAPESLGILKSALAETNCTSRGLPRGLSISAPLAELVLRGFDTKLRNLPDVYYCARYVDDVVVFSCGEGNGFVAEAGHLLPRGLKLNEAKSGAVGVVKCYPPGVSPSEFQFDYLGYSFTRSSNASQPEVRITIAESKVKKIKTRIVRAFLAHAANPDFDLLLERIRFLTANHEIDWMSGKSGLRAGIYYNYPLLNDMTVLDELTRFLAANAFAFSGSFGRRLSATLNIAQRRMLARHSFLYGFEARIVEPFSFQDVHRIMRCWSDV